MLSQQTESFFGTHVMQLLCSRTCSPSPLTVLQERLKIPTLTARMSGAVVGIVCSDQLSRGLRAW
jgi:hypothetical protein